MVREFGVYMCTLLYLQWVTNKVLEHRELCSVSCGSLDGRGIWRKRDICMSMAESFCCLPETITTLLVSYTPMLNKKLKKKKETHGMTE